MPPQGKNPNMARLGKVNPKWKGGISSDYQRRMMNAKEGEIVHHENKSRKNNTKENLKIIKPSKGLSAIGKHNQLHPEKGRK
jgi:hypothetical protein